MMRHYKKLLFAMFFLLGAISAEAQVTSSSIKGLVLDESNQPFSGANIVAIHTPSGTKSGAITNFEGRYSLLNMRVGGPYTVTITYLGYDSQIFNNVYLDLGITYNLNVVLSEDSQQLDAVVITGSTGKSTFGSDRTGQETNVGRRELTRLPSISRSAKDLQD